MITFTFVTFTGKKECVTNNGEQNQPTYSNVDGWSNRQANTLDFKKTKETSKQALKGYFKSLII